MKSISTIAAYLAVLVLAGVSSLKSAEPGKIEGKAIVRSVKGVATYTTPAGVQKPLTVNTELTSGDSITTGPDAFVYVSVNGLSSAVRISADTTMVIDRMFRTGSAREGVHDTGINLKVGSIAGQVKKVSADSRYEITTPHGVAGIRGTDFSVSVASNGNGTYTVTFTSITGTVVASAVVNGAIQTKTLNGGESWTVGGNVVPVQIQLLQSQVNQINAMITSIANQINPAPVTAPIGPVHIRPQPSGGSASQ
jgi:hypothetical protein